MASLEPDEAEPEDTTTYLEEFIPDQNLCEECLVKEHKSSFNINLLKNCFGNEIQNHNCEFRYSLVNPRNTQFVRLCTAEDCPRFRFWSITESGGNGWWVEDEPEGCDPVPELLGKKSCFVTSYGFCSKHQTIDLAKVGLTERIMDDFRPDIEVSEWCAGHRAAGCIYFMKVSLLDSDLQVLHVYGERKKVIQGEGGSWRKVTFTFKDYDKGVRYVEFSHAGQDTQYWGGHYGSKMCGSSVIAKIPRSWLRRNSRDS